MTPTASRGVVHLRAAGTSLVLDGSGPGLPHVVHWGPELPTASADELLVSTLGPVSRSALDAPWALSLLPSEREGWSGVPGLEGHRSGADAFPRLVRDDDLEVAEDTDGGGRVLVRASDRGAGLEVTGELVLDRHGVLRVRYVVRNAGAGAYDVGGVRALLPLPAEATEVLDLTGRWCRERSPQRSALQHGLHSRASRRGRTGHDATLLLVAGTAGFGNRSGEVWSVHLAWSGDHDHLVQRLPEGAGSGGSAVLGAGELLRPGEVRLAAGDTYTTPWACFVHAVDGLDGLSGRLHRSLRARPGHPRAPRPLTLNNWEATFFDHELERLHALVDRAAEVGVERFVLDDGWFVGRRHDRAGLGDWTVDTDVWPHGLHPLVARVRERGMQFGLWFEPEMVNRDSALVRAHPDWVLTHDALEWRQQTVLDVANPAASAYLLERISALVGEYELDYLKWDHNRDLHVAEHAGRPGVHAQTLATYALLDELRARHPRLEIESCASGGARVDLGILERTDRVWASDCNDALERQHIQRWTSLLLPPELVGAHVGPYVAHTTGRAVDLSMRCATALFGHAGIEWDITGCTPDELAQLRAWTALHRELRGLLHSGDVVNADLPDPGALLHGVVAPDGSEAVFAYVRLATSPDAQSGRVRFPGLDLDASYRVSVRSEGGAPYMLDALPPAWTQAPVVVPGAVLGRIGLPMPSLGPASALLLHLTAAPPAITVP